MITIALNECEESEQLFYHFLSHPYTSVPYACSDKSTVPTTLSNWLQTIHGFFIFDLSLESLRRFSNEVNVRFIIVLINFKWYINSPLLSELDSVLDKIDKYLAIPLLVNEQLKVPLKDHTLTVEFHVDSLLLCLNLIATHDLSAGIRQLRLL